MVRQLVQSMLRTWQRRIAVVLIILVVFVSTGYMAAYLVTTHGATSLEITVWNSDHTYYPPTSVTIFRKTITNLSLVRAVQAQIDGAPESSGFSGCEFGGQPYYVYQLRFATDGYTTQTYEGESICGGWSVTTAFDISHLLIPQIIKVYINEASLDGVEILIALHQKTGMPLPPGDSGWTPTV
jgi:hypothetical protein